MEKKKPKIKSILEFLEEVDESFPIPLSEKQDLTKYAKKLHDKGTLCVVMEGDKIICMVAGYLENVVDNIGYIAVMATIKEARHNGYASKVLKEFLTLAREQHLKAIHLYTVESNKSAVKLYESLNFKRYLPQKEERPEDFHMICYLK